MHQLPKRLLLLLLLLLLASSAGAVASSDGELASEYLDRLTLAGKDNAQLSVELAGPSTAELRAPASEVEALWAAGRFEDALAALRALEDQGVVAGVGIGWRTPERTLTLKSGDVRIGTRTTAQQVAVDYDPPSGNLFALVDWGDAAGWGLYISTDRGASWSETYYWADTGSTMVDLSVVDGFVYIAYVPTVYPSHARLRRCFAANGAIDNAYFWQLVLDASPATIREIALASDADNSFIFYGVMTSDDLVRFYLDDSYDGTTIMEYSPAVSNAKRGLDMAWNVGWPAVASNVALFLSYVGTDDSVYVHRLLSSSWDNGTPVRTGQTWAHMTSISAFHDTALVAFEYEATNGQGARYRITYSGGVQWGGASFGPYPGDGYFYDPHVTARCGTGVAMIYGQETGAVDTIFLRDRDGYTSGPWTLPEPMNDRDFYTGDCAGFGFEWLGVGYGIAYIDSAGAVYFVWPPIFSDGFESGNVSAWSASVG